VRGVRRSCETFASSVSFERVQFAELVVLMCELSVLTTDLPLRSREFVVEDEQLLVDCADLECGFADQ
jgi:hypothetical protein